jgi:hypothetical protein
MTININAATKLADLMGPARTILPVITFNATTGKLLFTPVATRANNYAPEPIDISRKAVLFDPAKVDCGWRAYASGNGGRPVEKIARRPAPVPDKPAEALRNSKGDAPWSFFVRLHVTVDGMGRAVFEIDERNGGRGCMESVEEMIDAAGAPFVVQMYNPDDTEYGYIPNWELVDVEG